MRNELIVPDWPAPSNVKALQTTRKGGFSRSPFDTFNLGAHVGDDPITVERNRQLLGDQLPSEPVWLEQVHGVDVVQADSAGCVSRADASVTQRKNTVCVVMTADCLPILLCDRAGTAVGALHAGWRGLAGGVIETAVKAMATEPQNLLAWLGPAIGPQAFEVGDDVRQVFLSHDPDSAIAFVEREAKYLADIYQLARQRLAALGVKHVYGGGYCTYDDAERFYSYRRDGRTGRMATMIWLAE